MRLKPEKPRQPNRSAELSERVHVAVRTALLSGNRAEEGQTLDTKFGEFRAMSGRPA
jgi:hypothetical protein